MSFHSLEKAYKKVRQDKGIRVTRYPEKTFLCTKSEVELNHVLGIGFFKMAKGNCCRIPKNASIPPKQSKNFRMLFIWLSSSI